MIPHVVNRMYAKRVRTVHLPLLLHMRARVRVPASFCGCSARVVRLRLSSAAPADVARFVEGIDESPADALVCACALQTEGVVSCRAGTVRCEEACTVEVEG